MNYRPAAPTGLPQTGDVIAGKYKVEELLGRGGVGVVMAAYHLVLRKRVAVKFLLPSETSVPDSRERFLREAQAAAALQSEHVTRVLDVGALDSGALYIVLEYLSGTLLSQLLKVRRRFPIEEAVDLILQTCEAIGEAHALGILHRDLKPQNLFVIQRGGAPFIKVLDFGLAKVTEGADADQKASLTTTSLVIGSPQYMSPEQFQSLKHVDARTDLWALGVILYQLVSGCRPFEGQSMAVVCESILSTTPLPLRAYRPDVPAGLEALVQRCLEKDLSRRVQSVAELVQGLAPFSRGAAAPRVDPRRVRVLSLPPAEPSPSMAPSTIVSSMITTRDGTTVRISGLKQLKKRIGSNRIAFLAATGAVVATALGMVTVGSSDRPRSGRSSATFEEVPPAHAPVSPVDPADEALMIKAPASAAPQEAPASPSASVSTPADLRAPAVASGGRAEDSAPIPSSSKVTKPQAKSQASAPAIPPSSTRMAPEPF